MIVYHGSYTEVHKPNINYGRFNLDFGQGFYVTGLKEQAEKWAMRRYMTQKKMNKSSLNEAIVSVYEIELTNPELKILTFKGYTEEWIDFVVKNRGAKEARICNEYDMIFGNIADDDVAAIVDEYMQLVSKGRMSYDGKRFFLEQLQYSKPNDQYCLVTQKAINALNFIKSYRLER